MVITTCSDSTLVCVSYFQYLIATTTNNLFHSYRIVTNTTWPVLFFFAVLSISRDKLIISDWRLFAKSDISFLNTVTRSFAYSFAISSYIPVDIALKPNDLKTCKRCGEQQEDQEYAEIGRTSTSVTIDTYPAHPTVWQRVRRRLDGKYCKKEVYVTDL